ncbi:MAG: metal-sensitive transcriptional regulator [Bacilli bacterium]|nr:metal-sensitive transcriptional regulator [Bacilli bacterium]
MLVRRLRIISGQISGIEQMIINDRYCDDVLIQISSTTNALKSLGNEILKSHMKTCMVKDIKDEKYEVIDDVLDLFSKLK